MAAATVDLVVLDIMLPGEDGHAHLPPAAGGIVPSIIMLTARGTDVDRIVGLEIGADDYVTQAVQFPRETCVARIRALLATRPSGDATARIPRPAAGLLRMAPSTSRHGSCAIPTTSRSP